MSLAAFDEALARERGAAFIVGIDEAGRGPLAGPVFACACVLRPETGPALCEVNDSKKLSPKKRERLCALIKESALALGVGTASAEEVDRLNILQATFLAMKRAVSQLPALENPFVVVDGDKTVPGLGFEQAAVIGGDGKSISVAAASIVAKVSRDELMFRLDEKYPGYGFAVHKGYGTVSHREAIKRLGPCPEHRKTFIHQ